MKFDVLSFTKYKEMIGTKF